MLFGEVQLEEGGQPPQLAYWVTLHVLVQQEVEVAVVPVAADLPEVVPVRTIEHLVVQEALHKHWELSLEPLRARQVVVE